MVSKLEKQAAEATEAKNTAVIESLNEKIDQLKDSTLQEIMSVLTEALSTTKSEFAKDLRETAVEVTKAYE